MSRCRIHLHGKWRKLSVAIGCAIAIVTIVLFKTCHDTGRTHPGGHDLFSAVAAPAPDVWGSLVKGSPTAPPEYIWWEAEHARSTDFPKDNPFAARRPQEAALLSGGDWIGADKANKKLFLEYDIQVPTEARYDFYVRKFWRHGPFRWRFDQAPWTECGSDVNLLDSVGIRSSIAANWVGLGPVELRSGTRKLRIELLEDNGPSAFDAFVLVHGPFTPRGTLKPGEKHGVAPDGWSSFEPDADGFADSPIDLRRINEQRAGDGGFIRPKGRRLIHERTGEPVRFWGINSGHDVLELTDSDMKHYARWLAKLGVNLVRLHGSFWRDSDLKRIREDKLAKLHRLIAALSDQGIYLGLSIWFPLWLDLDQRNGFDGHTGQHPFGVAYFDRVLQDIQKGWWRDILSPTNPYTGKSLAHDSAVAYVEIVNEDSALFSTFSPHESIPDKQTLELESQFGTWLQEKYGTLAAAFAHWDGLAAAGDDIGNRRAGLRKLWEITKQRTTRDKDTAEFLARLMRNYYSDMVRFIRNDVGYSGATVCSNWRTADDAILGPLDKWANSVCDIVDHHGYYSGPHHGATASYTVRAGDRFDDASALRFESPVKDQTRQNEFSNPILDMRFNDKPSFISEVNWTWPNRFRAELPFVAAAYGRLQGTDGIMFFASGSPSWSQELSKFDIAEPAIMGQFPADALVFRRALIREAQASRRVGMSIADAFALRGAPVMVSKNFDPMRVKEVIALLRGNRPDSESIDPRFALVGPVEFSLSENHTPGKPSKNGQSVDISHKVIHSATGELTWDSERGLVTVKAPACQAAVGFLAAAGRIELPEVIIDVHNEYGAITLVSLDERPIQTSSRLLLQVVSESTNTGWLAPGTGLRTITDVGGPPILLRNLGGTVSIRRADASHLQVVALDANGYPLRRSYKGADRIELLSDILYYLVQE